MAEKKVAATQQMEISLKDMQSMTIDVQHVGTGVILGVIDPSGGAIAEGAVIPTLMYALAFAAKERGFHMSRFGDAMKEFLEKVDDSLDREKANRVLN